MQTTKIYLLFVLLLCISPVFTEYTKNDIMKRTTGLTEDNTEMSITSQKYNDTSLRKQYYSTTTGTNFEASFVNTESGDAGLLSNASKKQQKTEDSITSEAVVDQTTVDNTGTGFTIEETSGTVSKGIITTSLKPDVIDNSFSNSARNKTNVGNKIVRTDRNDTTRDAFNDSLSEHVKLQHELPPLGMFKSSISMIEIVSIGISAVLIVLGLIGNTLIIVIMRKDPFKSTSYGKYITVVAMSDMLSSIMVERESMSYVFGQVLNPYGIWICKLYSYVFPMSRLCSSTAIVFICIERFVAVSFPIKAKLLFSNHTANGVICCTIIFANIIGGFHALTHRLDEVIGLCLPDDGTYAMKMLSQSVGMVYLTTHSFMPTVTLLIFTPFTLMAIFQHDARRRLFLKGSLSSKSLFQRVAVLLMSSVITYIALVSAGVIVMYMLVLLVPQNIHSPFVSIWVKVVKEIIWKMEQLKYSINIVIYGLVNLNFRKQFISICRRPCYRR